MTGREPKAGREPSPDAGWIVRYDRTVIDGKARYVEVSRVRISDGLRVTPPARESSATARE